MKGRYSSETILARLTDDCWLEGGDDGRLALHARALLELEPYLTQHYAEHVPRCPLCGKICVRGQACERDGCEAKYHLHCLNKMRSKVKVAKCQTCQTVIPQESDER